MALLKNKLLEELDQLRETIKEEEKQRRGRTPRVCSDEALKEIAKTKPLKISDFLAISGIGNVFMDEYATLFLRVILKHQTTSVNEVKVSKKAYKVLDNYKDRLTNISRRNPNLYMGRTVKRRSFDLSLLHMDSILQRFLTNKRVKVLPLTPDSSNKGDTLYRHITTLYRETNKAEKETGAYDLYIGYPYVEGVFKQDNFAIRAPLLYFPIKLIRKKRDFSLRKDEDKDIIFNRDLLLGAAKVLQSSSIKQTPYLDRFDKKTLLDTVLPYYENHGIKIKKPKINFEFTEFESVLKDKFTKRRKNIFQLTEYITFGRYKLYSSMIQKDMNRILESSTYNDLLEGLIDEKNLHAEELDSEFELDHYDVKEDHLSYINPVNYAQEKVIDLIHQKQKLVIWGPPGTGKSQTITSLIASSVLKGENILVVSEKKVALDVIYSRLKNASKYAMFIDDAENKQDFYHKLSEFYHPTPPVRTKNNDVYSLEQDINKILSDLDSSLQLLYNESIQDIPIYQLFTRYVRDKDVKAHLTPKDIAKMFYETYGPISFNRLQDIETTYEKYRRLRDHLDYHKLLQEYSFILKINTKLSRSNRIVFKEFHEEYLKTKKEYESAWFFKKRGIKKRFLQDYINELSFLCKKKRHVKAYLKQLFKDDTLHQYVSDRINKIHKIKTTYNALSNDCLMFLDMCITHPAIQLETDIAKERKYLFDAYYTGYLEEFKAEHQAVLYIIDEYQQKVSKLETLLEEKRHVTIESFEMELYKHALNLSNSKRIMDMKRVLESHRKMSVKAFIDTFQLELMNNIRVWMMTPEVVSAIIPFVYGMFDLVIFDEASQMYVEKGIPAIYRAKKVIIAGDTKQLRPSSLGIGRLEDDDEYFEEDVLRDMSMDAKSLLDLARYRYDETILNYHYRSVYEELIAFSNHAFYDGRLIVSPNQSHSEKPPIEYVYVKDGVFDKRQNEQEAKAIITLLRKIFRTRQHNETIGVITFSSTQRNLIENQIDEQLFKRGKYQKLFEKELFRQEDGEDKSLFVKNIENVQGDERDIIIFSMGYGKNPEGMIYRRFGWLNNEGGQNRLNVAISRAKQKIYFVSSLYPEELKVDDLKSTGPKLLKDYMRYCYYVSNKKHDLAKDVLASLHHSDTDKQNIISPMVEEIKNRLERGNYTVETSIGIGNYNIHLAVYDEESKTYQIGIICDVSDSRNLFARRDLLHQKLYLQARNWTTYRVFSSNWYKDPNQEMRNIRALIKS